MTEQAATPRNACSAILRPERGGARWASAVIKMTWALPPAPVVARSPSGYGLCGWRARAAASAGHSGHCRFAPFNQHDQRVQQALALQPVPQVVLDERGDCRRIYTGHRSI